MPNFANFPPYTITKKKCLNRTHLLHTQASCHEYVIKGEICPCRQCRESWRINCAKFYPNCFENTGTTLKIFRS